MSRSFRKSSIFGNAGVSEKQDKRTANRKFRKINKMLLDNGEEDELLDDVREVSDNWCFAKDGKSYWLPEEEEDEYYGQYLREMRK